MEQYTEKQPANIFRTFILYNLNGFQPLKNSTI